MGTFLGVHSFANTLYMQGRSNIIIPGQPYSEKYTAWVFLDQSSSSSMLQKSQYFKIKSLRKESIEFSKIL